MELSQEDEELLAELLLEWEDSRDVRVHRTAQDLCGQRLDLVEELNRRIGVLCLMDQLMVDPSAKTRLMEPAELEKYSAADWPSIPGFRVIGEIGRGGMGIVYRAIQLNLGRTVALKLINSMSQNPQLLISRLQNEADALGKLNLEHVIRVFDVIDRQGTPCLVLEYMNGGNLAQRDTQSSIDSESAAQIALTVARTMSDVHGQAILHRDLKPGNLLKDSKGRIKISDFGLAKHLAPNALVSVTTEGIGSPSYMAPEQAIGVDQKIGEWTDVYGIGATLYDLITGRPPFLGATHLATLEQVRNNDPVSPRLLVPEIPIDLETICLKCLAKEPRNRYPSAAALASDLENFLAGKPISARPLGPIGQTIRWSKRNPDRAGLIGAIALGFVLAVGLGAWEITRLNDAANEKRLHQKERDDALVQARTKEFYLSLAEISDRSLRTPTGWSWTNLDALKKVVRLRPQEDQAALYRLRSEATKALTAFDARKQRELLHGFDPYAIEFSPDGAILAAGANADVDSIVKLALIDTSTWETNHTLTFRADEEWVRDKPDGVRSMVFSPDGKELYAGSRSGWIYVFDLNSKQQLRKWNAHTHYIFRMKFSSDGKSLVTCSKAGSIKKWSPEGLQLASITKNSEFTDLVVLGDTHYAQSPMIAVAGQNPLWIRESDFQQIEPDANELERWKQSYEVAVAYPDGGGWIRDSGETFEVLDSHRQSSLRRLIDRKAKMKLLGEMHGIGISSEGRWLVTSNSDAAKLWDLTAGERVTVIPTVGRGRAVGRFHPDKNVLVLSGDSKLTVLELTADSVWSARLQQPHRLVRMTLSSSAKAIAATRSSKLYCEKTNTYEMFNQLLAAVMEQPADFVLSTYASQMSLGLQRLPASAGVCISFRDANTLQVINYDHTLGMRVESPEIVDAEIIRFSPDAKRLYFTSKSAVDGADVNGRQAASIKFVDVDTSVIRTLWINAESERTLRISSIDSFAVGSRFLTCTSLDGSVRILDPILGTVLSKIDLGTIADTISMSSNDATIIAGTRSGELLVISTQSGVITHTIRAHTDCVNAVTFVGEDLVVSGSRDGDLKLWRLDKDGSLSGLLVLGPLSDQVKDVMSSEDGNVVAVLVEDETAVRILRVDVLRQRLAEYGLDW